MDAQLESFKASISLVDVAINSFGYELDSRDSCKSSTVLRAGGDKLVVSKHKTLGIDVYFGRDPSDRGTVIDLCNFRLVSNDARLIPVRQLLRGYLPDAPKPATRRVPKDQIMGMAPAIVEKDLEAIQAYLQAIPDYEGTYLGDRGLHPAIIKMFPVGLGDYGNAIFVHHNSDGDLCGYEVKNKPPAGEGGSYTSFSAGGDRGLFAGWFPGSLGVERIVVTEAAIDAMSYSQLFQEVGSLYLSTAGSELNQGQKDQLTSLFIDHPRAKLVLAMDADGAGEKMAALVASLAPTGMLVERHMPVCAKDWNAHLISTKGANQGIYSTAA